MENSFLSKAWQPFTPRGVARFASASVGRLLVVQSLVAIVVGLSLIWLIGANFAPVVSKSAQAMPETASLQNGQLIGVSSGLLAEGKFLSIATDPDDRAEKGVADLRMRLRLSQVDICSLLGCLSVPYPAVDLALGRSVVEPWWGAWQPVVVAGVGAIAVVGLLLSWSLLALVYAPVARLMAFFLDRETSWRGCWKMCGAAQLTAALYVALAFGLYGLQMIDLPEFLFFYIAHFLIAWAYVFLAPFFLPRAAGVLPRKINPFAGQNL